MNPLLLGGLFDVAKSIITKIWPDPAQQAEAQFKLLQLQESGELARLAAATDLAKMQIAVNIEEAKSSSFFVSSWRPAAGWICVIGLGYAAIIEPIMRFVATMVGYLGVFPLIDTDLTLQILLGMLGLASARSWDKSKGVASK